VINTLFITAKRGLLVLSRVTSSGLTPFYCYLLRDRLISPTPFETGAFTSFRLLRVVPFTGFDGERGWRRSLIGKKKPVKGRRPQKGVDQASSAANQGSSSENNQAASGGRNRESSPIALISPNRFEALKTIKRMLFGVAVNSAQVYPLRRYSRSERVLENCGSEVKSLTKLTAGN
jgi:hypothetical protein